MRDGERRVAQDLPQHARRGGHELGRRNDSVHEPDTERLLRVDHLAAQEKVQRTALSNEAWEALRSTVARNKPELDLGLSELRRLGRDADVAGHGQLASAAQCEAVDGGDDRLRRRLESTENGLAALRERFCRYRAVPLELPDIGSGDESAAGAGEDCTADIGARTQVLDRLAQLLDGSIVEGVELVRTIDSERRDMIVDGAGEGLV